MNSNTSHPNTSPWQQVQATSGRAFHRYAHFLVRIGWWKFSALAFLLMVGTGILGEVPPFSWEIRSARIDLTPDRPAPPAPPSPASTRASAEVSAAPGAASSPCGERAHIKVLGGVIDIVADSDSAGCDKQERVVIRGPSGVWVDTAIEDAQAEAQQAQHDTQHFETTTVGAALPNLAMLWIVMSIVIKITYKGQLQAEARADTAHEVAEQESLKRQVVEARMAAMQAQIEPHFLFNTLASIEHLIETDPPRAATMQRSLIALLRASMPNLRGGVAQGLHTLGAEMAMVRPYLDILRTRMEERLRTDLDVPDGLLSAAVPPLALQSVVENAIKHGLEPKPEGGELRLRVAVAHGQLTVDVIDTGMGLGLGSGSLPLESQSTGTGTGTGLHNLQTRLAMLFGPQARCTIANHPGGGTHVHMQWPYQVVQPDIPLT